MLDEQQLQQAVEFHGHMCPGLAMGLQIGQIAVKEVGRNTRENPVLAVVETNLCPVDGVQFTTGCTFGMGAILFREYGKMAFTFFPLQENRGVRITPKAAFEGDAGYVEHRELMARVRAGGATPEEQRRFRELHEAQSHRILAADPYELFSVEPVAGPAPGYVHGHADERCGDCGEGVAEDCTRRHAGRTLCIPCFDRALAAR